MENEDVDLGIDFSNEEGGDDTPRRSASKRPRAAAFEKAKKDALREVGFDGLLNVVSKIVNHKALSDRRHSDCEVGASFST
ncbi:hypothetical protein MLD38_005185 [Melastoma candidum]|uniref:Uncharacterized protein n=1 Tax=Melastoma candidum TaxID=119954 RepID=A0ACB9S794_9MYRT|nr:hypothetical protein MLD38_005185 [Melastoma candidum]